MGLGLIMMDMMMGLVLVTEIEALGGKGWFFCVKDVLMR